MPTTYTATAALAAPRLNATGATDLVVEYSLLGTTLSSGDVILLAKVPSGVTIYDAWVQARGGAAATASYTIQLGTTALGSPVNAGNGAHAFNAFSVLAGTGGVFPYRFSLSDDAQPQWLYLNAKVTQAASLTATNLIKVYIKYARNGVAPF